MQALGKWVRIVDGPCQAVQIYSIMEDKCIDVSTLEENSIYCRWVENGMPVEYFIDILTIKKANAETITELNCMFEKQADTTNQIDWNGL